MKTKIIFQFAVLPLLLITYLAPAFAGPGGRIASAVFDTFWGKILLAVLTVLILPFILYVVIKENFAERRARKDLAFMAGHDPRFAWLTVRQRATDCFTRVHLAWSSENVSSMSEFMTTWYCQNQQMVYLDKWREQGLRNVCDIKKINNIKPLFFLHKNNGADHETSLLVISITANMLDYLTTRVGNVIVEGSKSYKDVETIWSFTLENGTWKVSNIEDGAMSHVYIKMIKELPKIEATVRNKSLID